MIYDNVIKLCKAENISIMQLEQMCGIGNGTIAGWGKAEYQPTYKSLKKIADHFEITVGDLTKESE